MSVQVYLTIIGLVKSIPKLDIADDIALCCIVLFNATVFDKVLASKYLLLIIEVGALVSTLST